MSSGDHGWRWHDLKERAPVRVRAVTQAELTGVKLCVCVWGGPSHSPGSKMVA